MMMMIKISYWFTPWTQHPGTNYRVGTHTKKQNTDDIYIYIKTCIYIYISYTYSKGGTAEVTQKVKKSPPLWRKFEASLPRKKQLASRPCPEPDECSSPTHHPRIYSTSSLMLWSYTRFLLPMQF
jgi:hypothetical protein